MSVLGNPDKRVIFAQYTWDNQSLAKNKWTITGQILCSSKFISLNGISSAQNQIKVKLNNSLYLSNCTIRIKFRISKLVDQVILWNSSTVVEQIAITGSTMSITGSRGTVAIPFTSDMLNTDLEIIQSISGRAQTVYLNGKVIGNNSAGSFNDKSVTFVIGGVNNTLQMNGSVSLFEVYNVPISAQEVYNLYNKITNSKLPTVIKDYTPSCFEGNNNAYIEVPDSDLLSFGDGVTTNAFWFSCWYLTTSNASIQILSGKLSPSGAASGSEFYCEYSTSPSFVIFDSVNGGSIFANCVALGETYKLNHLMYYFDGNNSATPQNGLHVYFNGVSIDRITSRSKIGTFVAISNQANNLKLGAYQTSNGKIPTGGLYFDIRIGSGTLTSQQVQDIYQGKAVGTERLWLPLCEDSGNVRFDVSGNGLHGILKGTQDGKYNVGRQPKLSNGNYPFDYYRLYGGSVKSNYIPSNAGSPITFPSPIINGTSWSLGIRLLINDTISDYTGFFGNVASGIYLNRLSNVATYLTGTVQFSPVFPTNLLTDGKIHSLIFYCNISTISVILDGITLYTQSNIYSILSLTLFGQLVSNPIKGTFWDLRTWNSNIGQTEALKYHSNDPTMIAPDHKYSLIGDNPAKDLIGSIDGVVNTARPIAIPLQASTQLPVLSAMTVTNPSQIVLKRNIKEVFRVNPNITGGISDVYGKPLTINGNVVVKQYGKIRGIYFNGTTSDYLSCGNILNNDLKNGVIHKIWFSVVKDNINNILVAKSNGSNAGLDVRYNSLGIAVVSNSSVQLSSGIGYNKRNNTTLTIVCIEKEKHGIFIFGRNGLITNSYGTTVYNLQDVISDLRIGNYSIGAVSQPLKGTIFDLSISTAGILTLEEATQIWNSEKQLYY